MSRSIIVGYDGSDESRDALALARALATLSRSPLTLVWIEPVGPLDLPYETILQPIQLRAREALDEVARGLRDQELEISTQWALSALQPRAFTRWRGGVGAAGRRRLEPPRPRWTSPGRHGRTRLLHGSPCPVAIAPRGLADAGAWRPAVIGVAYDGSPEAHAELTKPGTWRTPLRPRSR